MTDPRDLAPGLDTTHPLHRRAIAVATMHGKERVLAPPLRQRLDVAILVPSQFDTDAFGTFTGSIARTGSAIDAARAKARAAMRHCGTTAAVASEGSFGPHPSLPFVPLAAELVLLLDDTLGLEVIAEDVGTTTNFAGVTVHDHEGAQAFAARIGFPTHQLVLSNAAAPTATVRGIGDEATLTRLLAEWLPRHGTVQLTTDMRADRNPTRMQAIARAAERLAARTATRCPGCRWPGWGVIAMPRGLPCALCGEPTELVRSVVTGCARCAVQRESPRQDGRTEADPGSCPACNP